MLLYWVNCLYPRGGAGVPCFSLSDVVAPYCALYGHAVATSCLTVLLSILICFLRPSAPMYIRFWVGQRLQLVWGSHVALTWIGWARNRLPGVGDGRWFCAQEPWTPGCTGVWPTPKWWRSYSWCIRTSWSRSATNFSWVRWLSFSG